MIYAQQKYQTIPLIQMENRTILLLYYVMPTNKQQQAT